MLNFFRGNSKFLVLIALALVVAVGYKLHDLAGENILYSPAPRGHLSSSPRPLTPPSIPPNETPPHSPTPRPASSPPSQNPNELIPPGTKSSYPKGIVSFTLYGNHNRFTKGALYNAEELPWIYPGAQVVYYVDNATVPRDIIRGLQARKAIVIEFNQTQYSITWKNFHVGYLRAFRFFAMTEITDWDFMLFRDVDSRSSLREKAAVEEFLHSPFNYHVMRDHQHHGDSMLAGAWGLKREGVQFLGLGNMVDAFRSLVETNEFSQKLPYGVDQMFLRELIWKKIQPLTLVHDSFHCENPYFQGGLTLGYPMPRDSQKLVIGGYFDENNNPYLSQTSVRETPVPCRRHPSWTYG